MVGIRFFALGLITVISIFITLDVQAAEKKALVGGRHDRDAGSTGRLRGDLYRRHDRACRRNDCAGSGCAAG